MAEKSCWRVFAVCHLVTLFHCTYTKALSVLKMHCNKDGKVGVSSRLPPRHPWAIQHESHGLLSLLYIPPLPPMHHWQDGEGQDREEK